MGLEGKGNTGKIANFSFVLYFSNVHTMIYHSKSGIVAQRKLLCAVKYLLFDLS
jgi:hypothetical protein